MTQRIYHFLAHNLKYQFSTKELSQQICGVADSRIAYVEKLLSIRVVPRGNSLLLAAQSKTQLDFACSFFQTLQDHYTSNGESAKESLLDWEMLYRDINDSLEPKNKAVFVTVRGRPVHPKGSRQTQYVHSLIHNTITLGIGPAGTGKTFLSIATACSLIATGKRSQLIITRPAVEAGESLGFLPGDLEQKINPYLRPLYDALYECLNRKQVDEMISSRQIEIAPLAYMRGRTLNDAVVLLDEGQNCTLAQLKMFLTRLGRNSSVCLNGDITQIDLAPGRSGLALTAEILKPIQEVGIIYFQNEDIVRNPIVEKIIVAFRKSAKH